MALQQTGLSVASLPLAPAAERRYVGRTEELGAALLPFNKPSEVIVRVLRKLGANPTERLDEFDQDPEYTACRSEELPLYYELYVQGPLDPSEREVLCCFMLEGLNDFCGEGITHPLQGSIFDALIEAGLHSEELDYWTDTSDPDAENWWPVTKALVAHRSSRVSRRD